MTSKTQFDTKILLQDQITMLKTYLTDKDVKREIEMAKIKAAIEKRGKPIFRKSKVTKNLTEKAQKILTHLEGPDHGLDANEHLDHLKRLSATLESGNQNTKEKLKALNTQHSELEQNNTDSNKPAQ